ncbi:hypothetical protein PCANC_16591 [Puccinia coronata f. sp. avenae]|uniref:Fatty acid hydroxylase domain-containing protein n=1 Tax=Puccinia coronata f. sp. avenae TaxID=200324 RepID=A0A2N5UM41_9BASI|nr:hypothetical protein PCANC_16591 [Puccinia coronata f. sp. avenae]
MPTLHPSPNSLTSSSPLNTPAGYSSTKDKHSPSWPTGGAYPSSNSYGHSFHMNQFLYKHIHLVHHRLYCPYSFGALYNHLLEGFILDTLGAVIAHWALAMSVRQATLLFGISTAKTVDDHCGLALPFDPLQHLFGNNVVYHDIHHQQFGIKKNFLQTYFVHRDVLMRTHMTSAEADARRAKISGVQRPATAAAAMPSPLLSLSLSVPASLSLLNSSEDSNMDSKALTSLKL